MKQTTTILKCDAKGCKREDAVSVAIPAGWNSGPPEVGPWNEDVELCAIHLRELVQRLAEDLDHKVGKELANEIRNGFLDRKHGYLRHVRAHANAEQL